MIKLMLVDDEQLARARMRRMLEDEPGFEVVGEAASGLQAIEQAEQLRPDIILMDVRMPSMDGLEAAAHLAKLTPQPAVVFCTAYDEYAIQAFEVQAVGYLLKPVRKEKLTQALQRAQAFSHKQLRELTVRESARTHLSVKTYAGIELIPIDEISHLLADQKYVTAFHFGREIVIDEPLKSIEEEFAARFLRIHRNCLVALAHVDKLVRDNEGASLIKMKHFSQPLLKVSRRHLASVKQALKAI